MSDQTTGPDGEALASDDLDTVAGGAFDAGLVSGLSLHGTSGEVLTTQHNVGQSPEISVACLNPQPLPP